jgi:antitoxin MazE
MEAAMTEVVVGKWGKSLAVRVPLDVVQAAGLTLGETLEMEMVDGDVVLRRSDARAAARRAAQAAAESIIARSKGMSLGGLSIREMIDEGRR